MTNKKIAIMAIAAIAIVIASIGAVSAFELFGMNFFDSGSTTDFDTKFMSGTFTGNVSENQVNETEATVKGWTASYEDKEHNITYNMSCVKNGSFVTDLYQLQGMSAPEKRNYNDQSWKIFYSQAVPTINETDATNGTNGTDSSNSSANNTLNVYICEADINGTAYTINVISYDNKTKCDGTLFCPLYKDYIEPLVKSVEFKDAKNAPKMSTMLNLSDGEFKYNQEYLNNLLSGNAPATGQ